MEQIIPNWIKPGSPVTAFTLQAVVRECGLAAARAVDEVSGPCPVCGLNTFGGVVCLGCQSKQGDETEIVFHGELQEVRDGAS